MKKGLFSLLFAGLFLLAACSHFDSIYKTPNYNLEDLRIDSFEARGEILNGYRGYGGKVVKVSPLSGNNWSDYSRTIYWDWELEDIGFQQIIVSMSVLVESPNSGRPQTSAYKPAQMAPVARSNIKWNGPANIGWTVQVGDEYFAQFGGKPVEIPAGKWVDLTFSQAVDVSGSTGGQIYIDGHGDQQGLLDMILYIRNFTVLMKPTDNFIALTFDDSPSDFTDFLLDKLDDLGVKATFFISRLGIMAMHPTQDRTLTPADRLAIAPERMDAVKRIFEDGHEIGNLLYFGSSATEEEARNELEETRIAIQKAIYGENDYMSHMWATQFIRNPNVSDSQTLNIMRRVSQNAGLPIINGINIADSNPVKTSAEITENIVGRTIPWTITISKDPRSDPAVLRVLDVLIPRLRSEGYVFVTLSEMMDKRRLPLRPGNIYSNLDPESP